MMNRRRIVRGGGLVAAGALATLTLAGCAGLSSGSAAPPPTTPLVTTGVTTTTAPPPPTGGSTSTGTPPGSTSGPPRPPECKVPDLKLTLGPNSGAAGHFYQALDFTNTSSHACVMVGFPGVSYVGGGNGTQVGAPAQRDGQLGPQVTVAPGAVVSSIVSRTDTGVFDPSACQPTAVDGLRVYPPDETHSMFVSLSGSGCAGNPPGPQLLVQTIMLGPGSV